jgi:hypothetical protein
MLKLFILAFWFAAHPVHVTLLSVEYSDEDKAFSCFLKVYYDDFLLDYKLLTGTVPSIDINGKEENAKETIESYLADRVQIFAGDTKLNGKISGLSLSDNELKINMLYDYNKKSNKFTVKNSILTDIYKDQSNLLIFRYGNFEEGIKLTTEAREKLFKVK